MRPSIPFVSYLATLASAHDAPTSKLPTFREALYKATHDKSHVAPSIAASTHEGSPEKPANKIFFEIVRINERLMVDQDNHAKGYNANLHSALYTVKNGRLRRLFGQDIKIIPKPGSPMMKAIDARNFLQHPTGVQLGGASPTNEIKQGFPGLLENLYKSLNLDRPIPAFLAAIALGFLSTALLYGIAYVILLVIYKATGYSPVSASCNEATSDDSEEQLLNQEQKRMEEAKPLIAK